MESPLLAEPLDAVVHAAAAAAKIDPEPKSGVDVAAVEDTVGVPKAELAVAAGVAEGLPKAELAVAEGATAGLPKIEPPAAGLPKIELDVGVAEAPKIEGEENVAPPPKTDEPAL